jgi:hypothetical protein
VDLTMPIRSVVRSLAIALCLLGFAAAVAPPAEAQLSLRVGPGSQFQPMPIAVADFAGEGDLGPRVSGIIASNLQRSGYFVPLDRARFPERPSFDTAPRFDAWRAAGAQALVTGRVLRDPSGRVKAEFRLWDVYGGQQITGQQYVTDSSCRGGLLDECIGAFNGKLNGGFDSSGSGCGCGTAYAGGLGVDASGEAGEVAVGFGDHPAGGGGVGKRNMIGWCWGCRRTGCHGTPGCLGLSREFSSLRCFDRHSSLSLRGVSGFLCCPCRGVKPPGRRRR